MSDQNAEPDQTENALPEARKNRPVTTLHWLEYTAFRTLLAFFLLLGLTTSSMIAGQFMRHLGPLLRPVSKRAEDNLALIYPTWPQTRIKAVTKSIWEGLGRTAGEFAHLGKFSADGTGARIDIIGQDKLDAISASGKPVIFITGHFANWEVIPVVLRLAGANFGFVYRAANNPLTDQYVINHRAKFMTRHQIPKGKRGGRALIENLKADRSILMLVDQKLNTGISVPFLGQPAMTAPAAARLSLKLDIPIVPLALERANGARFRFTVYDEIDFVPTGDTPTDIKALTLQINETLGETINARPDQWLWFHRRWRKKKNA